MGICHKPKIWQSIIMPKKAIDIICKSSYKSKNNEVCNWQNFEKIYIAKKLFIIQSVLFNIDNMECQMLQYMNEWEGKKRNWKSIEGKAFVFFFFVFFCNLNLWKTEKERI